MSQHSNHDGPGYERKDIQMLPILAASVFILGLVLCFILFADIYFVATTQKALDESAQYERTELVELKESQQAMLEGYGELEDGKFRIPIGQAMDKVIEKAGN